jgi:hypothetical protein
VFVLSEESELGLSKVTQFQHLVRGHKQVLRL